MSAAEGATPLMYACQQSREKEVLEIVSRKRSSVRERDRTLKTPLHYCAENSSTACAEAVLRAAPDLLEAADEDGYTALHLAVIAGNRAFLRFLISRGANVNALDNERHSAVHWATVCGEEEALEIVLRAGADVSTADIHGGYPLHYAAQMCGPGVEMGRDPKVGLRILNILLSYDIDINAKDKDGRQPILWAASAGSADAILALVKAGASVEASDKDGLTALHCAASRGHTDCLETLVTLCGASVDIIDSNGCTALFYAVTLGHADATQLLLSLGAEPNRQDRKGRTPAHCGAAKGQLETLRILLGYGANLWLRNVKGDFPLHEAVASGRRDLVLWLLSQRLDSNNVGNNDGRCPIHIAAINNNIDMIKILFDAQSLVNPIMRTTKGILMTPLDAALHRGFRGCAKYLQLHGGVPFSKLTEKSSNIKGVPSRKTDSDMGHAKNMSDQFEISHWGQHRTSAATLSTLVPRQVRMGSDAAIQQIETTHIRAVAGIEDDYDDMRSSDDNKIYRRRRRRKKADYREKGFISEEDSNCEDHPRSVELPRRKVKAGLEGDRYRRQKKKEQYDESSSESDYYRRKTMRKKNWSSDSDEKNDGCRPTNRDRRKYHSETEASEDERRDGKKVKSKRESRQKICVEPCFTEEEGSAMEKDGGTAPKHGNNSFRVVKSAKAKEVNQTTIITVHEAASENVAEAEAESTSSSPDTEINASNESEKAQKVEADDSEKFDIDPPVVVVHDESEQSIDNANVINHKTADSDREAAEITADQSLERVDPVQAPASEVSENVDLAVHYYTENETENGHNSNNPHNDSKNEEILNNEDIPNNDENDVEPEENDAYDAEDTAEGQEPNPEDVNLRAETADAPSESEQSETEKAIEVKDINENADIPAEDLLSEDEIIENTAEDIIKPEVEFIELPSDVEEDISDGKQYQNGKLTVDEDKGGEAEETKEEDAGSDRKSEENEVAFQLLNSSSNPECAAEILYPKKKSMELFHEEHAAAADSSNSGARGYRIADAEGSMGDESGGSTRNEDSSALPDSGIEPSPRRKLKDPAEREEGDSIRPRVPRPCNRSREEERIHSVSVTQTVQNTIRKYQVERKIFYQLLELKRLQIRAGRANEQVLVKRLVDEYRRGGIIPGLKNYSGHYTFRQFEKFLYDQLRTLQSTAHVLIPKIKPSDDIETLSTILRKTRVELVDDIPDNPIFCTQGTHRCHHAAHAYTGIPCAAYITKFNHHEMPKTKTPRFLPYIDQVYSDKHFGQQASFRPVTLELSHGKEKQVISLPTDRLDKNKRYYVTFTIKGGPVSEETKSARQEERMLRHRHAKSF